MRRSSVDRMACVEFPSLALQLLLRDHEDWREYPVAVVDRDKAQGTLLEVNRHATAARIRPGQRYAAALSLCAELRAAMVDEDTLQQKLDDILERLHYFSSGIEPSAEEPGVFWVDASGLSLLYPSLEYWADSVLREFDEHGLYARMVVGFSRFGTRVLTRHGKRVQVYERREEELAQAHRIGMDRLPLTPSVLDVFYKLGVRTLADFARLPAAGIRRRFDGTIHRLHQMATGDLWAPLQPSAPVEPLQSHERLDYNERDLDSLLHRLKEHLIPLRAQLLQRRRLLRALQLRLQLENGAHFEERLQPAQPTLELDQVMQLLRLRLQNKDLRAGVIDVALQLEESRPSRRQMELFASHARRDLDAAHRAFARLRAELGDNAVQVATIQDGHLPQARFTWQRIEALREAHPRLVQTPRLVRRIVDHPIAVSTPRRKEPDGWLITGLGGGAVEEVRGPYVISGGWWTRTVHREYHYVRTSRSGWLWVYFDRRRRRWYLQGSVE
jgi:protein ImuB